ncbi:hypothetical protein [Arthrobacter alpinus]|uniref:hypothetical protein n=1 Tax=Arthrobacter alpinus TaxID=656366 RepID=UPI00192D01C7|nr:hypothetical protein [Arthrobacter alpinus]
MSSSPVVGEPARYRIRVGGLLGDHWAAWFDGLTLTRLSDGTTAFTGTIPDQAALHGLLVKVRSLGLVLVSVESVESVDAHKLRTLRGTEQINDGQSTHQPDCLRCGTEHQFPGSGGPRPGRPGAD